MAGWWVVFRWLALLTVIAAGSSMAAARASHAYINRQTGHGGDWQVGPGSGMYALPGAKSAGESSGQRGHGDDDSESGQGGDDGHHGAGGPGDDGRHGDHDADGDDGHHGDNDDGHHDDDDDEHHGGDGHHGGDDDDDGGDPPVNSPPLANAGPDQSVAAGQLVQLDGSGSSGIKAGQMKRGRPRRKAEDELVKF